MKHTLVTFLGRGRNTRETPYRPAKYRFPDGGVKEHAFFGLALTERMKPDTVVILGTRGSQWGALVEHVAAHGDEDARIALLDAETGSAVDQGLLDRVTPLMRAQLGCDVVPRLIPFGESLDEQYDILATIARVVPGGAVSFDLTHGFRHLAMVGFLSAFMLEHLRNLRVEELWYGALDMTQDGITPALKLDGLVRVRSWVAALERYDATGDLRLIESLLIADGVPHDKAKCLADASFYERILNVPAAENRVRTFLHYLSERSEPLGGASGLFREELEKRLRWVDQGSPWQKQRALACQYLERHDFVRAAMLGWEAYVNREYQRQGWNIGRFNQERRSAAIKELEYRAMEDRERARHHRILHHVRNTLAHTTGPPKGIGGILKAAGNLRKSLRDAFAALLADDAA